MRLQYSCVETSGESLKELEYILDHESGELTYEEFAQKIGSEELRHLEQEVLGYTGGLTLKKDWHVHYFKSHLPDKRPVYYVVHSAVEYVYY